ncbi:MAG: hypothetical protein Q9220_001125 [cf. Caloplaca sp. 1 TL-2023]
MDFPSPKRRKLCPTDDAFLDVTSASKRRPMPSYLAPTKASLARFHPALVSQEVLTPKSRSSPSKRTSPGFEFRYSGKKTPKTIARRTSRKHLSSPVKAESLIFRDNLPRDLRASPPEPVSVNGSQTATEVSGDHVAGEYGSLINGHHSEELPPQTSPRTPSRREPEHTGDSEPRLPSTPTQLGLEPPPSPNSSGLSNLTPKKLKRKLRLPPKSSPLKSRLSTRNGKDGDTPGHVVYTTVDGYICDSLDEYAHAKDQILKTTEIQLPPTAQHTPGWATSQVTLQTLDDTLSADFYVWTDLDGVHADRLVLARISTWVAPELRPPLQALAAKGSLISIRHAILEHWKMAMERAQCWAQCARSVCGSVPSDYLHRSRSKADEDSSDTPHGEPWEQLLGRQSLLISRRGVTLVVGWQIVVNAENMPRRAFSVRIIFENDGEEAQVGIPETKQLCETLDALVDHGRSVSQAIEVIVRTVFSEDDNPSH